MLNLVLLSLCVALTLVAWQLYVRWRKAQSEAAGQLAAQQSQHEAAQHAQSSRMEAMLDSMIEGLVVLDPQGRIALANRAAEAMFGFSRMMAGGTLLEAIRHHEVAAVAAQATNATAPIEHEVRLERPVPRVLQISAVALRDPAGAPAGAVLVFHDVTQLRRLEAMRQDFVANVSHELRTPLSLIKSAAETLLDGGKNDAAINTRFLEIIDKHASRLSQLIDELLLLARLDAAKADLNLERVSLKAAAQEALDEVAMLAQGRGVTLRNDVPADLAAQADASQLRQVFSNLVNNAVKYGRTNGTVVVSGQPLGSGEVEVTVQDDGAGIPAEALERVFERFYRVDKARSREQGGTGLGLSIVKNVVQAHGGEVRVESELHQGATFFFTLPAAIAGGHNEEPAAAD
jgi:two-component system phosphate regulon sensor histidine kinase PhoR